VIIEFKMLPKRFTIRVYGILVYSEMVLISHEKIGDFAFTKFPGGGLEFGEGSKECLVREFKEETGIDVEFSDHIYTCDFFVQSKIDPEEQVIGIYYLVKLLNENKVKTISLLPKKHDFRGQVNTIQHAWISLAELKPEVMTFEMDKRAVEALS
jgi:8-oxo-dGTP diphosphatase